MPKKKCIFHIPNALDEKRASASQIRPKKMKEAFEHIGYEVDAVWGTAKQRAKAIKKIKKNIKYGVKYDFAYSESSTMPTLLTEQHHLPTHPLLDFSFFSFLKRQGIKIGLFYRDMYWKFPTYKEAVKGLKYYGALGMYRYDLYQYNRLLTKFYLPSLYAKKYLTNEIKNELIDALPPACEKRSIGIGEAKKDASLNLLYIGGLGSQYKIHKVFEVVRDKKECMLVVCCREDDWEKQKKEYIPLLGENISIVHKKGKELVKLYEKADICLSFFKPDLYMNMAMPYKIFEYLSYGKPVISSKGTAFGEFTGKNETGWQIVYTTEAFRELLNNILQNPELLEEKRQVCLEKIADHTWEKRAEKVAKDLKR